MELPIAILEKEKKRLERKQFVSDSEKEFGEIETKLTQIKAAIIKLKS